MISSDKIKLFITDVDGVMTNAGMYYSEKGDEFKKFNARDGGGFILLRLAGIKCAIVTQEKTKIVERRAKKLGIPLIQNSKNKVKALHQLTKQYKLKSEEVAYIGDDINDILIMKEVGFSFAVADACEEVKKIANHITNSKGGEGAVREAAEFILKKNNLFDKSLKTYLGSTKTVVAVIQARSGSIRLSSKPLKKIGEKPLLQYVIERLFKCNSLNKIILATTTKSNDKKLINLANGLKIKSFAGDENNVLNRIIHAANKVNADIVVRICADNPFIDPSEIDRLVYSHIKTGADYTTNIFDDGTLAILTGIGFAIEVISLKTLNEISTKTNDRYELEHVTPYIYKNPGKFKLNLIKLQTHMQIKDLRLTIDTKEDLEIVNKIHKDISNKKFISSSDIIDYVKQNPQLLEEMKKLNQANKK